MQLGSGVVITINVVGMGRRGVRSERNLVEAEYHDGGLIFSLNLNATAVVQ